MGEFEFISRYLAPISGEGAGDLKDDVAAAYGRLITKDLLVESVHFLGSDPLDLVARKALRVNMSDLIAKGAKPEAFLLGLVWPEQLGETDFALFCDGLRSEIEARGLSLLGGDTTRGPQLTISITMVGQQITARRVTRAGALPGDLLAVTGPIGAGLIGLEAARAGPARGNEAAMLYWLPEIPFGAEATVSGWATASIDVSDGLIADARHLAMASRVRLIIEAAAVPLAEKGEVSAKRRQALLTAGDDYQVLFSAPARALDAFAEAGIVATRIGRVDPAPKGEGELIVLDADGSEMRFAKRGYDHFVT